MDEVCEKCLRLINEDSHVDGILNALRKEPDNALLMSICTICHALAAQNKFAVNSSRFVHVSSYLPKLTP